MSRKILVRAALGLAAVMVAAVAMESQADAGFLKRGKRGCGGCEASCGYEASCAAEPSCGCAVVEEPVCAAPEPSCGCPVVEESCGCAAEPSCGCNDGCGRKRRLFGRRNRGCGGCESSCGCAVEVSRGVPVHTDDAPSDAAPPAPEAPTT